MVLVELQGGTGIGEVPFEQLAKVNPNAMISPMFLNNVFMISKFFKVDF